jgi:hypothetical protein
MTSSTEIVRWDEIMTGWKHSNKWIIIQLCDRLVPRRVIYQRCEFSNTACVNALHSKWNGFWWLEKKVGARSKSRKNLCDLHNLSKTNRGKTRVIRNGLCHSYDFSLSLSLSLYSPLDLGHIFSFLILHTVGRIPWKGDQPVARPLPTHRTTQAQNKRLDWDSNPGSQCSSGRRQFMP